MMAVRPLITNIWLKEAMRTSPRGQLQILESMWIPKEKGQANYINEHIPTARYFDMWEGAKSTPTCARPLPNISTFAKQLERKGVTDGNHVVLYDKNPHMFFSTRMWLQCKEIGLPNVSVLEGGFGYWKQQGFPVETGEESPTLPGNITLRRSQKFCGLNQLEENLRNQGVQYQMIDARQPEHFRGEAEEPSEYTKSALKSGGCEAPTSMHAGHVTSAKNLFYETLFDSETGCFKSEEELMKIFSDAGVDLTRQTMSMCYNAISACLIPFAASKCGADIDNFNVYVGSWTEYGQIGSGLYLETGPSSTQPLDAA